MYENPKVTFLFIVMALAIFVLSAIWVALYVELRQFRTGQPHRQHWPTGDISWTDVIIACFAGLSVIVAWQYTHISENAFEASNRPYISIHTDSPALTLMESTKNVCFHFIEANDGSVPAYHMREHRVFWILGRKVEALYMGLPPSPHEHYLGPHGTRHVSACTEIGYDYISANINTRSDTIAVEAHFEVDYNGVNNKAYHYHDYASYSNSIQKFVVVDEGESAK